MTADDLLGLILGYEVFAALSRRGPLVTTVCRKHRWLAVPVIAAATLHLLRKELPCLTP